jgi:hypothetical protein
VDEQEGSYPPDHLHYLHGLSSGDFVPALGQFLGSTAGLSAPVITKLTETWKAEQRAFAQRDGTCQVK